MLLTGKKHVKNRIWTIIPLEEKYTYFHEILEICNGFSKWLLLGDEK